MRTDAGGRMRGARWFVGLVYWSLALSFIATTGVMIWEFWDAGWLDHLATHSHLFLYFPTFGIVSLIAFYAPATVLTDLYWRRRDRPLIRASRTRFVAGAFVILGLSIGISYLLLASPQRSAWEIAPGVLLADRGVPENCATASGVCERMPVLSAISGLRAASQSRLGLADLVRDCGRDRLLDVPPLAERKRICFAASPWPPRSGPVRYLDDASCCAAQEKLRERINGWYQQPTQHSLTALVHTYSLWAKVFFLLTLLAISLLLTIRHRLLVAEYSSRLGIVEIGLMVGMGAAVLMPLMSEAFVQSSAVLVGTSGHGTFSMIAPALTVAFAGWALLLLFFFYRQRDRSVELMIKVVGALGSIAAGLKFDAVVAVFVRFANSGIDWLAFAIIGFLVVGGLSWRFTPWARRMAAEQGEISTSREQEADRATPAVVQ